MIETDAQTLRSQGVYMQALGTLLSLSPCHEQLSALALDETFSSVPIASDQAATQRGVELLETWARSYEEAELSALTTEYLRLFEGPGMPKAPLWESVYTCKDGRLVFQAETLHVREWYKAFNLQIPNLHKEPDDNLAFELQFIGHLTEQAAVALEEGAGARAEELLEMRNRFCGEHVLRWGFDWCKLVEQEAKEQYFRGLAYLVEGLLSELGR